MIALTLLTFVFLLAASSEPLLSLVLTAMSVWWLLFCIKERA